MNISPFCCDITSGTKEEQNEFKRLWKKIPTQEFCGFIFTYYGISKRNEYDRRDNPTTSIELFTRILPLSEGILILKKMVGEEEKPDQHKLLKEIIVNELLTWSLSVWKDNGECRDYEDLSPKEANELADYIISSFKNSLQPKP